MQIKIQSDTPIDNLTIKQVIDIFKVSQCPNESLWHSIPRFNFFNGEIVQIGEGNRFMETIYIEA